MRAGLGGHETLNLYAEAIAKMPENPGIPPLFRDIFKNAYLPYRDPETLKMFLKVVDEFEYDHSERLGDAFEYLLSVLGSQGDAGQFRTPRHLIDFIVAIVDPKKTETVLDPACGTAGFLISAYKHILQANVGIATESTKVTKGSVDSVPFVANLLTPDERGRLAQNFKGYDISPDMVRLSLVNLYLHGFAAPRVSEYDTLTSLDKWSEYADVILANPPFMSPKGGIKPHNRFSVQSKRSEVLFVDYMAEHLTPSGRAGIIVPEGIIFQSQTAYKALRKMLVDTALVAVVSLPAGVFNPYSGVKTSILILDKALAKKANSIAFFKVENDGFGLGAQRRAIEKNDLPQVLEAIKNYKLRITNGEDVTADDFVIPNSQFVIVPKARIAANGDYNLSGERYREGVAASTTYPKILLSKIAKFTQGTQVPVEEQSLEKNPGYARFLRIMDYTQDTNEIRYIKDPGEKAHCEESDIIMVRYGAVGFVGRGKAGVYANNLFKIEFTTDQVSNNFAFYIFNSTQFRDFVKRNTLRSSMPALSHKVVGEFYFPLPPLSVQQEIVAEIEGYQEEIRNYELQITNCREKIAKAVNKVWGSDED